MLQRWVHTAAPTPLRGSFAHTISRQSVGVTLITGMQHLRVTYNNSEYDPSENGSQFYE